MKCDQEGRVRKYHGETSRNLSIRSKEHLNLFKSKNEKSFMHKHAVNEHSDDVENVNFEWKVKRTFQKALKRQLFEAKCIDNMPKDESLNSKEEFNGQTLRKIELAKKTSFVCKVCGKEHQKREEIKIHFEKFHQRINCDKCDYKSFGEIDMKYHMKKHVQT